MTRGGDPATRRSADDGPALLATCRLQLRAGLDLDGVRRLVPYLQRLGVSHLYLSPMQQAVPGSTHGYDVTDPAALDAELGTTEDLRALCDAVHAAGMGVVLDIVPNHLAAHHSNRYWRDVLKHGRDSQWAHWFDIDWNSGGGRIVLPILGARLPEAIANGDLRIAREDDGSAALGCHDFSLPLRPGTEPDRTSAGDLPALLEAQHYRLVHWRRAGREINYRRFFTISELAALRQEDPAVFQETHESILGWVRQGWIDGLRIDHVDGLLDPAGYLERLRAALQSTTSRRVSLHVEKILARGETLPAWPVEGTTGYDFVPEVDDLFLEPQGYHNIEHAYRSMLRRDLRHDVIARSAKLRILRGGLNADVRRVVRQLQREAAMAETVPDGSRMPHPSPSDRPTRRDLEWAVVETIAALGVYRTYLVPDAARHSPEDRQRLDAALASARRAGAPERAMTVLEGALLRPTGTQDAAADCFLLRFQQLCVPAAAKGVEDTAFYAWAALASRNEVGGDPDYPIEDAMLEFDRAAQRRADRWPAALLAVTTHDTKRSADVRARLAVLSEMAAGWWRAVGRWRRWNRSARQRVRGRLVPDANMEYLLYQTLVGVWPMDPQGRPIVDPGAGFADRIAAFMQKAAREAKQNTTWIARDELFEAALESFVRTVLDARRASPFLADFHAIIGNVIRPGIWNALARTLLHMATPGVPDVYRGDERWLFALVDPDNRAPADFDQLAAALDRLLADWDDGALDGAAFVHDLLERPGDGDVKQHIVARALAARRQHPAVFGDGSFERLAARGSGALHVVAFARRSGRHFFVAIAPRLVLTLAGPAVAPTGDVWGDTMVRLPYMAEGTLLHCRLSGQTVRSEAHNDGSMVRLSEALSHLPVALLEGTVRDASEH
jgi:(1->4)-alpha-D-glucan 1-alpha-D-glucosylmutase